MKTHLGILIALALVAGCGKKETTSTDAQFATNAKLGDAYSRVRSALVKVGEARERLCPMDPDLRSTVGEALRTIERDTSMSETEKQRAAEALFLANQTAIESAQAKQEECKQRNLTAMEAIARVEKKIVTACLPPRPQRPGERQGPPPPLPETIADFPAEVQSQVTQKVNGQACAEVVESL